MVYGGIADPPDIESGILGRANRLAPTIFNALKAFPVMRSLGRRNNSVQLRVGAPFSALFMKRLTAEQSKEYTANPLATDEKVRTWCRVPEDWYYTVAMRPLERAGGVRVTTDLHHVVGATKISKSSQARSASWPQSSQRSRGFHKPAMSGAAPETATNLCSVGLGLGRQFSGCKH